MTPEQIQEYQVFCKRFIDTEYIDYYKDGEYYNALGSTDFDDNYWDKTEDVRIDFDQWIEKTFPDQLVHCYFNTPILTLNVYALVYSLPSRSNDAKN